MAKTNLEQTSEKGMIPLVFVGMDFDGKSRYKRMDTGEVLVGRVEILMQDRLSVMMNYSGQGTIRMKPALEKAGGLLFPENPKPGELYKCPYCGIHPEEKKEDEKTQAVGGFSIPK